MVEMTEVRVPDIGDFSDVPVIEILVEVGDRIRPEDPLVTLESDKATMDVPAPAGGVVREVAVAVGDNVSEGSVLLRIAAGNGGGAAGEESAPAGAGGSGAADMAPAGSAGAGMGGGTPPSGSFDTRVAGEAPASPAGATAEIASRESSEIVEVRVPDIGDFSDVPVIEVLVGAGDRIRPEDPLVSLESDKATMDVPSPVAGRVAGIALSVGDLVSEGALILTVESAESTEAAAPAPLPGPPGAAAVAPEPADGASAPDPRAPRGRPSPTAALAAEPAPRPISHATPAMRRYARELGVDLAKVTGTGRKGRVLREDVSGFVKRALSAPAPAETPVAAGGSGIPSHSPRGFLQVRGNRDAPAVPHQAHLGAASAPLLGERPPRHQPRRGGCHRAGSVPPIDQGRGGGGWGTHHPPRLHHEGGGLGARGVSGLQRIDRPRRGHPDRQEVHPYRHRRGHPERADGAGVA